MSTSDRHRLAWRRSARPSVVGALCLGAAALLGSPLAGASEPFPALIQEHLGMPCEPLCTICHQTLTGGLGTVHKPFGLAMKSQGVFVLTTDKIAPALDALEIGDDTNGDGVPDTAPIDSDLDGTPDIAELRLGLDPNLYGPVSTCITPPAYGCGARIPKAPPGDGYAATAALMAAFGLVLSRLVRRRHRG